VERPHHRRLNPFLGELGQQRMSVDRPPIPTEDRLPAWRRACFAYSEMREAGATEQAHEAAVAAVQTVLSLEGS
jgi:hypothetical protein